MFPASDLLGYIASDHQSDLLAFDPSGSALDPLLKSAVGAVQPGSVAVAVQVDPGVSGLE